MRGILYIKGQFKDTRAVRGGFKPSALRSDMFFTRVVALKKVELCQRDADSCDSGWLYTGRHHWGCWGFDPPNGSTHTKNTPWWYCKARGWKHPPAILYTEHRLLVSSFLLGLHDMMQKKKKKILLQFNYFARFWVRAIIFTSQFSFSLSKLLKSWGCDICWGPFYQKEMFSHIWRTAALQYCPVMSKKRNCSVLQYGYCSRPSHDLNNK